MNIIDHGRMYIICDIIPDEIVRNELSHHIKEYFTDFEPVVYKDQDDHAAYTIGLYNKLTNELYGV